MAIQFQEGSDTEYDLAGEQAYYEALDRKMINEAEANEAGSDAYDDGKSIHDNPYTTAELREAWHLGWRSEQDRWRGVLRGE